MHTAKALPLLAVCALINLPGAARAQQDFSKVEIKAEKLAGNVYFVTGAGGNIAAVVGEDGIALVDDQFAPLAPKIRDALARLSPKPVRFVINTHWHGDHTGGNLAFAETASILAHANVRKRMAAGQTAAQNAIGKEVPPAPPAALPVVTFEEGVTLYWGGEEIRVIHLRPGHTDGDSAVIFTKASVVHLGDDFFTTGFPFVDLGSGGSVRGMIAALDELVPRLPPDATIIPGHGAVSTVAEVKKFARSLEEMVQTVEKSKKAGKSAEQMKKEKILEPWATWGAGFVKADMFLDLILKDLEKK